jgi:hypothetical protein
MTTVLSPIELAHLVQVVRHSDCGFRAECSCGWAGAWDDDQAAAELDAVEHRQIAAGPPTGLDAVLSGLLDLQDDLADVVMWLAENWSADLPSPFAHATSRTGADGEQYPGVTLLVYCSDRDELVRLASLFDAPMVPDAEPNRYGSRWERAVRGFGRVRIDAYRSLDPEPAP